MADADDETVNSVLTEGGRLKLEKNKKFDFFQILLLKAQLKMY